MLSIVQKNKILHNLKWKNLVLFFVWVFIFSGINIYLNDIAELGLWVLQYENSIKIPYLVSIVLNTLLIWLSVNLLIDKMKEVKSLNPWMWIISFIGTFFALLTWACPWCIAGIFPLFVWLFGSHMSMYSLPFHWVEIQILSLVFLIIWIYFLSKDMTCEIKPKKKPLSKRKKTIIVLLLIALFWSTYAGYNLYKEYSEPKIYEIK